MGEVLELFECCKELIEKLDFLDSKEHEEVSNTDVTAMVQKMLQEELGGLMAAANEEALPVNDLGVAKSVAEPKEDAESKKPVAKEVTAEEEEKTETTAEKTEEEEVASKMESKVSIESSSTGVKRALEDASEEQPQKKQKIE